MADFLASVIVGILLGGVLWFLILQFVSWFTYGFSDKWSQLHCFKDHWKGWLIFFAITSVIGIIFKFTVLRNI